LAVVFAVNLVPAFGPPTWGLLVFFSLDFDLPAVLLLGGPLAAASGRLLLATATRKLPPRLARARLERGVGSSHRRAGYGDADPRQPLRVLAAGAGREPRRRRRRPAAGGADGRRGAGGDAPAGAARGRRRRALRRAHGRVAEPLRGRLAPRPITYRTIDFRGRARFSSRLLLPLGDLDPRDGAPLSDAALTPYHAIKRSLHLLVPGSTATVIGVGGLGHMGVQLLRALSPARIVAVDVSEEHLKLASEVAPTRP
jgi:hypothetical protein